MNYKLIKQYPGCHLNIGDIVKPVETKSNGVQYLKTGEQATKLMPANDVENYPEFFQKCTPIAYTTDKVPLFGGFERLYYVRTHFLSDEMNNHPDKPYKPFFYKGLTENRSTSTVYEWFSSEDAAKLWIHNNKPVISRQKIKNLICVYGKEKSNPEDIDPFIVDLLEIIK